MSMPELTREVIDNTYQEFSGIVPNPKIQKALFWMMGKILKPHLEFLGNSQDTLKEHLFENGQVMLLPNHCYQPDSGVIGGLVNRYEIFRPMQGSTAIAAKKEVLDWFIVGGLFRHIPAHPVYSSRHFNEAQKIEKVKEAIDAQEVEDVEDVENSGSLRIYAADAWAQFNINHINNGGHATLFPEGGCNKKDQRTVQTLKTGFARIALGVKDPSKLLIVPAGMAYRFNKVVRGVPITLKPVMVLAEPFSPQGMQQDELIAKTHEGMQIATDRAFEIVEEFKRNK
jgi:hypothetical protein